MLKGFVSGEEKDIVRIPMKGKNLAKYWKNAYVDENGTVKSNNQNGMTYPIKLTNEQRIVLTYGAGTSRGYAVYETFDGTNLSTLIRRVTFSGPGAYTATEDCYFVSWLNKNNSDTMSAQALADCELMLNLGSQPLPYEPYGYQEGWEVRDSQDRLIWGREDELQTATGTLPFKGYALPVKVKSLLGNAVQNGTPAPDNPVMPEFVGMMTANLFDKSDTNLIFAGTSLATANEWYGAGGIGKVIRIPCNPSTTYTISGDPDSSIFRISMIENEDIPVLGYGVACIDVLKETSVSTQTFTTTANTKYILVQVSASAFDDYINVLMLNTGETALPYEPFGYKIPISCGGETTPVYLGEVPTVRRVKKLVLTGEENWRYSTSSQAHWIENVPNDYINTAYNIVTTICTHYRCIVNHTGFAGMINGELRLYSRPEASTTHELYIKDDAFSSAADFKSYLADEYAAGHPVIVWYVLSTPETTISNEPLCKISTYTDELTTIQVHGLSAPLYGIGDYKDTLNLSTGVITRKVKRLVLKGREGGWSAGTYAFYNNGISPAMQAYKAVICSHYPYYSGASSDAPDKTISTGSGVGTSIWVKDSSFNLNLTDFKAYLAAQYAAGTPVTVWYVLNTPETETVTVPTGMTGEIEGYLTQVSTPSPTKRSVPKWNGVEESGGTYAVTVYTPPEIPTTTGQNTLTVDSNLAPSSLTVKGHIKELA